MSQHRTEARSTNTAARVLAFAATLIVGTCAVNAFALLGRPFPGFLLWENLFVPAVGNPSWTGVASGLRYQSWLLEVDDAAVGNASDVDARLVDTRVGETVRYTLEKDGERYTIETPIMTLDAPRVGVGIRHLSLRCARAARARRGRSLSQAHRSSGAGDVLLLDDPLALPRDGGGSVRPLSFPRAVLLLRESDPGGRCGRAESLSRRTRALVARARAARRTGRHRLGARGREQPRVPSEPRPASGVRSDDARPARFRRARRDRVFLSLLLASPVGSRSRPHDGRLARHARRVRGTGDRALPHVPPRRAVRAQLGDAHVRAVSAQHRLRDRAPRSLRHRPHHSAHADLRAALGPGVSESTRSGSALPTTSSRTCPSSARASPRAS